MAYDEFLADRIRQVLRDKNVIFEERNMMGGLCFMVDEKMCVGLDTDKPNGQARFMGRIGEEAHKKQLNKKGCSEFDITGRPMKGFVFVSAEGIDMQDDLEYWVQLCLDFNPLAKKVKRKQVKKLKSKSPRQSLQGIIRNKIINTRQALGY